MRPQSGRKLVVVADDFGIGPATSAGILDLAQKGLLTGTVLLVNSPFARQAVASWRAVGAPVALGWHPNLTLDRPVSPPHQVASLIDADGIFWPLGKFMRKLALGRIWYEEVETEWRNQYRLFLDLVGQEPALVNSHQHVSIFPSVGGILLEILRDQKTLPYLRRLREPWSMLWTVPGARIKRGFLSHFGRRMSRRQAAAGFPGNDWLAGVTDPRRVENADFFENWLRHVPGKVVELSCHPGHWDATLVGRDCSETDGMLQRRVSELKLLGRPQLTDAARDAGFELASPKSFADSSGEIAHAA